MSTLPVSDLYWWRDHHTHDFICRWWAFESLSNFVTITLKCILTFLWYWYMYSVFFFFFFYFGYMYVTKMVGKCILHECDGRFGIDDSVIVENLEIRREGRKTWESPNPSAVPNSISIIYHLNKTVLYIAIVFGG